jgi:glutamine amidotransferase-like uncharacterized protein
MNLKFLICLFVVSFISLDSKSEITKKKIALVYKGEGSCIEGCSEAVAKMAQLAGYKTQYVGPDQDNSELFKNAAIWLQPGGESLVVDKKMNPKLKKLIQNFVFQGGAYAGFCAGGFLATKRAHAPDNFGFGLIKAKSSYYDEHDRRAKFFNFNWNKKKRKIYWEDGPYFEISKDNKDKVHVFAEYLNGTAASIAAHYGKGTVIITGVHPEAPDWWENDIGHHDTDGSDNDLAVEMITKAIKGDIY